MPPRAGPSDAGPAGSCQNCSIDFPAGRQDRPSLSLDGIPMSSDLIKHISDASFEADVLNADLLSFVEA